MWCNHSSNWCAMPGIQLEFDFMGECASAALRYGAPCEYTRNMFDVALMLNESWRTRPKAMNAIPCAAVGKADMRQVSPPAGMIV